MSSSSSSPPRPLPNPKRPSAPSPNRRPLAERSDSGTNEQGPPTIRIVDTGPSAYAKSPFPSEPAHFLPPRTHRATVSDENAHVKASVTGQKEDKLSPQSLQPKSSAGKRISTDTSVSSDSETLANFRASVSPSLSSRYSFANTTTPSTPTLTVIEDDSLFAKLPSLPKDQGRASTASQSTIRLVTPERQTQKLSLRDKDSNFTVFSTDSTDTVGVPNRRRPSNPSPSPNFQVYSSSTNSLSSSHDPTNNEASETQNLAATVHNSSSDSVPYSVISVARPRSASSPPSTSHVGLQARDVEIQFPVVKQATVSGSFATISEPEPEKKELEPRMNEEHRLSTWSLRLSTIPSESEPRSQDEVSAISSENVGSRSPRLRRVYGSISSVGTGVSSLSASSIPMPQPLFTPRQLPSVPQGRESEEISGAEEGDDTLGELPAQTLKPQRSGYFSKYRGSRPGSSESVSSQLSFVGELSWVRNFYRSGEWPQQLHSPCSTPLHSTSRLNTATSMGTTGTTTSPLSDAFPAEIHRPRNRPRIVETEKKSPRVDNEDPDAAKTWVGRLRHAVSSASMLGAGRISPHLHRDRRENARLPVWASPSLEAFTTRKFFEPLNRQIWLFCLGFIFPLAWFLAAFLPLPGKPVSFDAEGQASADVRLGELVDIEQQEKIYAKAHWWRTLNRVMCVAGVAVIAAIITLVVLATRIHP